MKWLVAAVALLNAPAGLAATPACESLPADLTRMVEIDQAIRSLIRPDERAAAARSDEGLPRSLERMRVVDRHHEAAFETVIRRCGWPRKSVHGEAVTGAAWLLVQHASAGVQRAFLPLLERAHAAGEVSGSDVAYLTDRLRIRDGRRQLYGTQWDIQAPCVVRLLPIDDPAGVDARRQRMAMPSLDVYLAQVRQHFAQQGCSP